MILSQRIDAFAQLGEFLSGSKDESFDEILKRSQAKNGWFTEKNIQMAIKAWGHALSKNKLDKWVQPYQLKPQKQKKVGIIMAGNLPLVGLHDLISVVISGHHCVVKMSSQDDVLISFLINKLIEISPEINDNITIVERIKDIEAVIATGSDNSSRYFEYYFGKYPHIIRKNRTSVAVVTGNESESQLIALGKDVFSYFGLGCRNVSKVFFPSEYDISKLLDLWNDYREVMNHHKYINNYDYHKSILLVNGEKHLDTGFSLWRKTNELVSPLSVIYYDYYEQIDELQKVLVKEVEKIQCTVSILDEADHILPGMTQQPELWDYADGVDTLQFLDNL